MCNLQPITSPLTSRFFFFTCLLEIITLLNDFYKNLRKRLTKSSHLKNSLVWNALIVCKVMLRCSGCLRKNIGCWSWALWANVNYVHFHVLNGSMRSSKSLSYVLTSLKITQKMGSFKYNLIKLDDKKSIWYILITLFYDLLSSVHLCKNTTRARLGYPSCYKFKSSLKTE